MLRTVFVQSMNKSMRCLHRPSFLTNTATRAVEDHISPDSARFILRHGLFGGVLYIGKSSVRGFSG